MLRVAFVLPFGELSEGFFPDTMLSLLCSQARLAGHHAAFVRVYYDGRDRDRDRQVGERLRAWLAAQEADLVVVERLFDPAPIVEHLAARAGRSCVLVTRGDSFDPMPGVELVIGATAFGATALRTRRTPSVGELNQAFLGLLQAFEAGRDPLSVPGVARVEDGTLREGQPSLAADLPRPFHAALDHDVICQVEPPRVVRKTLFGNSGCPFAADPLKAPHFSGVKLPTVTPLARLGCAFCSMGGDYQKRPDAKVVEELVEQAAFFSQHAPEVEEFVLADQHALRYLEALIREATQAGVRRMRWLFAARADSFVREKQRVSAAIAQAERAGHTLEVYLSGFEAFSDRELARYNKGADVSVLLAAVSEMRRLRLEHPTAFDYSRARGHSLILWNPWTTPADLHESASNVRRHGLRELFDELGRNRLRLYADLPIYYAAERDGALSAGWQDDDEGAGRRKGYNTERPWRFLDPRTHLAYALAQGLRELIGAESEVAQLRAVSGMVTAQLPDHSVAVTVSRVLADAQELDDRLTALTARERASGAPPRAAKLAAAVVLFAGPCNNGCDACANRDSWLPNTSQKLIERIDAARAHPRPIMLAGREPSLHPDFFELLLRCRGEDNRGVGVVSNGRRFGYVEFTRRARRAGLSSASVKLFAPDPSISDVISRDPGGFEQAVAGVRSLVALGVPVELRVPLHRLNLHRLDAYVALAVSLGAAHIRLEAALDAIGLDRLSMASRAVESLSAACATHGLALEASPLASSTLSFDWMPLARPAP